MDTKKLFGKNLRKYRKAAGLSQEQLAAKSGVSAKHICSLETGVSFVSAELLDTLCLIVNVRPQFFFVEEENVAGKLPPNLIDEIANSILSNVGTIITQELKSKLL